MKIAYQYRLRPTKSQSAQMETWLNLLRRQYNYRLWQRFDWCAVLPGEASPGKLAWEHHRCAINACPLVCSIAPPTEAPEYYGQKRDLVQTKAKYPEYSGIYSSVLQDCIGRVKKTFDRFIKGDSNGKRSGKPRYKQQSRYRSFTYPQMKGDCISGKFIALPKIGKVKMILHRPIPDGFVIKTCTVIHKADGWYVTLSLQDDTVPAIPADIKVENVVGIDVGLKDFLVTSEGEVVPIPQFQRRSEKRKEVRRGKLPPSTLRLMVLNKALSRKKRKGTHRRQKAGKHLSKHYQKVARQRKDFHYKTATWLLNKYDVIAHEDLNIKGLAKTHLSKSVLDAGWGEFIAIVTVKAERAGRLAVAVNPNGTTQECSGCGEKVPKTLKDRWHSCPHCGLGLDRDHNAARNIKQKAEGHPVFKAHRLRSNSWTG